MEFYDRIFRDNEIEAVYMVELDHPADWFKPEKEEIEEVLWMPVREVRHRLDLTQEELLEKIRAGEEEICIVPEEFRKLVEYL